jgi:hypothetical protein
MRIEILPSMQSIPSNVTTPKTKSKFPFLLTQKRYAGKFKIFTCKQNAWHFLGLKK